MTFELHQDNPEWHFLDRTFDGADVGLAVPTRNLGAGAAQALVAPSATSSGTSNTLVIKPFGLKITGLDRGAPPNYKSGSVPRDDAFLAGSNILQIRADPAMPIIDVGVQCTGFDPASTPILFRLQTRHVLGRFVNQGSYRYRGKVETFQAEWQGTASAARFRLFDADEKKVTFTFGARDDAPSGGHAILTVAARPPGASAWLVDYVHLRIGGTNPAAEVVSTYVEDLDRNENITLMLKAIFAHESSMRHFHGDSQSASVMTFRLKHHAKNEVQHDCRCRFEYPRDPANHPHAAFDFGVGVSQITRTRTRSLTGMEVWDWRENVRAGANILFDKLRGQHKKGITWIDWAVAGMHLYNGAGTQAEEYARTVRNSEIGRQISHEVIPADFDWKAAIAHFEPATRPWPPPAWEPDAHG